MAGRVPSGGVSVTSRVADILETFAGQRDSLSLSEVARRTGLPLTTTHRLVGELVSRHFLERDESGRYQIGLRLWELASHAPRSVGLRESALPIMEDLYEATHENVQLAIIDGTDAVYVERIAGRDSVQVLTRPGLRLPVHATAVGLVLLAHASPRDAGGSVELAAGALHPLHDHGSAPVAADTRRGPAGRIRHQRPADPDDFVVGRGTRPGQFRRGRRRDLRCRQGERQRVGTVRARCNGGCAAASRVRWRSG